MKKLILSVMLFGLFAGAQAQTTKCIGDPDKKIESRHEKKLKEREAKATKFKAYIDSLVVSDNFAFKPYSFQLQPAGRNRQLHNINFRMDIYPDNVDIYLPYYKGIMPPYRIVLLNYMLTYIPEYTVAKEEGQWTISFSSSLYSADKYDFKLTITNSTGDAELEISSNTGTTVTYSGSIVGHN